jgi:hypothetical protein
MCCHMFLGTPAERTDCMRSFAITKNVGAFVSCPFAPPVLPGVARGVHLRVWSATQYNDVSLKFWVYPPLVNGAIVGTPSPVVVLNLSGYPWTSRNGIFCKTIGFAWTPSVAQVTDGVCFVAMLETAGNPNCTCPVSLTTAPKHPLAAVYDRPF